MMAEPANPQIVASKPKRLTRILSRAMPRNYDQPPLAQHGLKPAEPESSSQEQES